MEKYTEFTGRTVDEAIEEGLKQLSLTREEADIRVLEEGKKKLFGSVKARVEIASKNSLNAFEEGSDEEEAPLPSDESENEENASESVTEIHRDSQGRTDGERAVEFLEGLFDILRITATTELVRENEKIEINVTAADTIAVIGRGGAMLDAIQTIAGAVANTGRSDYRRVVVDCENYRENREETLKNLALRLADKSVRFEKKLKLEPMNPYERRIIHAALSDHPNVRTESEGKEPHRYIVIIPNNLKDPDSPAVPARPERPQRGGYNGGRYNRDRFNNGGYRKPYNREGGYNREGYNGDRGGYRKPYNYNRDTQNGEGYRKPYNRDGGYNRDRYNNDRGGYNPRPRENNGENATNNGRREYNNNRGYDRNRNSSSYKKSNDFFGTYLGNSKENKDE